MSGRGAVIGAATAALVLFALVAMHGLPFTPTAAAAATPAGTSHHAGASDAVAPAVAHDAAHHAAHHTDPAAVPTVPVAALAVHTDSAAVPTAPVAALTVHTDSAAASTVLTAPVAATSDDAGSTAPHAHSVWHLCLAVLVAVAGLALVATVGRRITDLIPRLRGRLVRVLESRALDPPSQSGLCLLRC